MSVMIGRRELLAGTGLIAALALVPGLASATVGADEQGITLYDPALARAHELAKVVAGWSGRAMPIEGDPVRFWRQHLAGYHGTVSGVTGWSDYVLFRGLAAEKGLRVREEVKHQIGTTRAMFQWTLG